MATKLKLSKLRKPPVKPELKEPKPSKRGGRVSCPKWVFICLLSLAALLIGAVVTQTVLLKKAADRQKLTEARLTEMSDNVSRKTGELDETETRLQAAESQIDAMRDQIDAAEQELADKTDALAEAEKTLQKYGYTDAEAPSYCDLYPDFYAPQPYQAEKSVPNTIYLTFDDGPSAVTRTVLKYLKESKVKATFFVLGKSVKACPDIARQIVAEGHTIAMHSYSHSFTCYESVEAYLEDMYKCFCAIKEVTGVTPTMFRFIGGSINSKNTGIYTELISEMVRRGFVPYDWNAAAGDATSGSLSTEKIIHNAVRTATKNNRTKVLLMHDAANRATSAEALPEIIRKLKAAGYSFAPITPDVKPVLYPYRYYG